MVTVAHCCYQLDMSVVKVVAGEHDLYAEEGTEQSAGVGSYWYHELYDPYTQENDICLLQLEHPLSLNAEVNVVKRAGPGDSFSEDGRVSGWGDLYEGGVMPDVLMSVEVPLWSDQECRQDYGDQAITDSMLCAGDTGKAGYISFYYNSRINEIVKLCSCGSVLLCSARAVMVFALYTTPPPTTLTLLSFF